MKPSNHSKFNKPHGKTKNFPIKQFRFDVSQHPVINSNSKCSFKIRTILSQQEELMLIALGNMFNVPIRETMRIALSEVARIHPTKIKTTLPLIQAESTHRAHTARERKLQLRITKEDKEKLKNLEKHYGLTEQAALRLAIVYIEKHIRSGTLTDLENSKQLSQGEVADAYFKSNPKSSGKLDKLKDSRDKAKEEKIERDEERYRQRGEMIDHLISIGDSLPRDLSEEIDLNYIDYKIAEEKEQCLEFAFESYIEDLLNKKELDEKELRIEKEMFRMEFSGLPITRQEAIEMIAAQDELKRPLTEEEEQEIEEWFASTSYEEEEKLLKDIDVPILPVSQTKLGKAARYAKKRSKNRDDSVCHYMIAHFFDSIYPNLAMDSHPHNLCRLIERNILRKFYEEQSSNP